MLNGVYYTATRSASIRLHLLICNEYVSSIIVFALAQWVTSNKANVYYGNTIHLKKYNFN